MAKVQLTLKVSVAWWVWPYLAGVQLVSWIHDLEPDFDKVSKTVLKGISIDIV